MPPFLYFLKSLYEDGVFLLKCSMELFRIYVWNKSFLCECSSSPVLRVEPRTFCMLSLSTFSLSSCVRLGPDITSKTGGQRKTLKQKATPDIQFTKSKYTGQWSLSLTFISDSALTCIKITILAFCLFIFLFSSFDFQLFKYFIFNVYPRECCIIRVFVLWGMNSTHLQVTIFISNLFQLSYFIFSTCTLFSLLLVIRYFSFLMWKLYTFYFHPFGGHL